MVIRGAVNIVSRRAVSWPREVSSNLGQMGAEARLNAQTR